MRSPDARKQVRKAGWLGIAAIAVAALIAYIAYNALSGLPLQSRYRVTVVLPDANRLISADDVRIAGVRVGQVSRVRAMPAAAHSPLRAEVELLLESAVKRLPVDSTVNVSSASPLGATYVELTPGRSAHTIPDGGVLHAPHSSAANLVDLFAIFDRGTREHFQRATSELSTAVAGRGAALNTMIGAFNDALPPLTAVAASLAAPSTRLDRFLRTYASAVDALAQVQGPLQRVVTDGVTTFDALARERRAIGDAIALAPQTERSATTALRAVGPPAAGLARLAVRLQPVARRLPRALDEANATLSTATPALRGTRNVAPPLEESLAAITRVASQQSPDGAVRKLAELFDASQVTLGALLPAERQCNLLPLFFQSFASYIGVLGSGSGPAWLGLSVDRPGAQTDGMQSAEPAANLHVNYLPHEDANECEAGNEPFDNNARVALNPPGNQAAHQRATTPPPHVLDLARQAGLLATAPEGR